MKAKFEEGAPSATARIALEQSPLEVLESFESTGRQDDFISNFGSHLDEIRNQSQTHDQSVDLQQKINSNVNVVQRNNQGAGMSAIHEEGSHE